MKFSAAFLSLFALSAMAAPSSLQDRNAAPIDSGAVSLIEGLEGFRANFYEINGHKTVGKIYLHFGYVDYVVFSWPTIDMIRLWP